MTYRWAEHTAEVELEIEAPTEEAVFTEALHALAELLGDGARGDRVSCAVAVTGSERAVLLAQWLDELVVPSRDRGSRTPRRWSASSSANVALSQRYGAILVTRDTSSRARPCIAWRLSPPTTGSARRWCSMSDRSPPGVAGFRQVDEVVWELPASARADMRVPARMSRTGARREITGAELRHKLEAQGIVVRCPSNRGLAEEAPFAYKDVERGRRAGSPEPVKSNETLRDRI
jgi:hypothetical protein